MVMKSYYIRSNVHVILDYFINLLNIYIHTCTNTHTYTYRHAYIHIIYLYIGFGLNLGLNMDHIKLDSIKIHDSLTQSDSG